MEYSDVNNNANSQASGSCNGMLYTIRRGDTLYRLSKRYNVSLSTIMNANPNVNVYNLQVGQQICIPGATSSGSGQSNQGMPNRRPGAGNRYPDKLKGDQFQNYQCPACPECPAQQPREACPTCPEQQPCPECEVCPTCPECRDCPVCPTCPTCPTCPVCPEQQPCPECERCPEQQPCPACPECERCPEQQPCPECPEQQPCPSCPEQMPCPECEQCPEQQPCPSCPEQMPCPTCKDKHTIIYVGPKYEKSYKKEKPCYQKPMMECKKPMMECQKPMMDCKKPMMDCQKPMMDCQKPMMEYQKSERMYYNYMGDEDMDARMWNRSSCGCSKDYDMGYRRDNRMMYDYDDMMDYRMNDRMYADDYYMGDCPRKRMAYQDADCGCGYAASPAMDMRDMVPNCHKTAKTYGCKAENKCYDTDYMDYQKTMYRGCFKKAKERPCE